MLNCQLLKKCLFNFCKGLKMEKKHMFCSRKMEHHAESHDNRHLAEIVRQLDRRNAERSTHAEQCALQLRPSFINNNY